MPGFKLLDYEEWEPGPYEPLAYISLSHEDLERISNVRFERGEGQLGPEAFCCLEMDDGSRFILIQYLQAPGIVTEVLGDVRMKDYRKSIEALRTALSLDAAVVTLTAAQDTYQSFFDDFALADAIEIAARKAIGALFEKHQERFYYCSLITTGGGNTPYLSAWSKEALERAAAGDKEPEVASEVLKWSYADSPYCAYGYVEYFTDIERLIAERPTPDALTDIEWESEVKRRIWAMEWAMGRLDKEGLFGQGEDRLGIVIGAEVMPPDSSNIDRIRRLNPEAAIEAWLKEAAES